MMSPSGADANMKVVFESRLSRAVSRKQTCPTDTGLGELVVDAINQVALGKSNSESARKVYELWISGALAARQRAELERLVRNPS